MAYTRTTWQDGQAPAITAAKLNNIETGLVDAHAHIAREDNPHKTTASQVKAVALAGDTMTGGLKTGGNRYWIGETNPIYGLDLNGSSLIGVDELAFKEQANGDYVGLAFLKNGANQNSARAVDYNYFRIDGNGNPIASGKQLVRDGDNTIHVGPRLRVTSDNDQAYIQAGADQNDVAAKLIIARKYTATSTIQNMYAYVDNSYFSGQITAGTLKQKYGNGSRDAYVKDANVIRSTDGPSGGADGDLWIQY